MPSFIDTLNEESRKKWEELLNTAEVVVRQEPAVQEESNEDKDS